MVLDAIKKEAGLTSDTLEIKKGFSVYFLVFIFYVQNGFGTGGNMMRKPNVTERMSVNIVTPDNNMVIQPSLPLPN